MDPQHRDRVAFLRVCSGKFERNMMVKHARLKKEIKLARQLERFKCPEGEGGCKHCQPLEKILRGESVFVGTGDYGTDLYANFENSSSPVSEIL